MFQPKICTKILIIVAKVVIMMIILCTPCTLHCNVYDFNIHLVCSVCDSCLVIFSLSLSPMSLLCTRRISCRICWL